VLGCVIRSSYHIPRGMWLQVLSHVLCNEHVATDNALIEPPLSSAANEVKEIK